MRLSPELIAPALATLTTRKADAVRAAKQRLAQAQQLLRPVERLRGQAEAVANYLGHGETVLDVGCGTGHLSAYLPEMYGVQPTGVDVKGFRRAQSRSANWMALRFRSPTSRLIMS